MAKNRTKLAARDDDPEQVDGQAGVLRLSAAKIAAVADEAVSDGQQVHDVLRAPAT